MSILDLFKLDGQVAVVTGGGKGLGRGIALALADAGADVFVAARSTGDLAGTVGAIRERGRRASSLAIDVTAEGAMETIAAAAAAELGPVTIWVNNAGGVPGGKTSSLRRTPREAWDALMDLNLTSVWRGAVAAGNAMRGGGVLINISSRAGTGGHAGNGPYAASKAAVNSLTATLAAELAPGIRVNAIAPGPVPTDNFKESVAASVPEERRAAYEEAAKGLLGRLGTPDDIGAAVVFLASPAASWITGQVLPVTGRL